MGGDVSHHIELTESEAVGSKAFVEQLKQDLGVNAKGRYVEQGEFAHTLREPESAYSADFGVEKVALSHENTVSFDETAGESRR